MSFQGSTTTEGIMDKYLRHKEKKETNWRVGLLFIIFLSCLFMFVMICIGAVYIQQLQDNMQRLEQRVRVLENSVNDRPCKEESTKLNTKEHLRVKRTHDFDVDIKEDNHLKREHHGIPSHHIAYVYGDPEKVGITDESRSEDFRFEQNKNRAVTCRKWFINLVNKKHNDYLCKKNRPEQRDQMMLTKNNHFYYYFAKPDWMKKSYTKYYYHLHNNGTLSVKKRGLYIVHASIHFTDLTNGDTPHYGVYKMNADGSNKLLISKCAVTVAGNIRANSLEPYPCQAWQLVGLQEGDLVYLHIGGYTWFRIEKETFHLALIRLNEEDIQ